MGDVKDGSTKLCKQQVSEPPWYFHTHVCDRPAKYLMRRVENDGAVIEVEVCGIHSRKLYRHGDWAMVRP